MGWRESIVATSVFWLVMGGGYVLAEFVSVGLLVFFALPPLGGLISGLLRPRLPALALLLFGSVLAVAFAAIVALIWVGPPDDPHGEAGEVLAAAIMLIIGSTGATLFTAVLGAFVGGPVQSVASESE